MTTDVRRAATALFPEEGHNVEDVKWFEGFRSGVTGEELASELLKADAQIRTGAAVRSEQLDYKVLRDDY